MVKKFVGLSVLAGVLFFQSGAAWAGAHGPPSKTSAWVLAQGKLIQIGKDHRANFHAVSVGFNTPKHPQLVVLLDAEGVAWRLDPTRLDQLEKIVFQSTGTKQPRIKQVSAGVDRVLFVGDDFYQEGDAERSRSRLWGMGTNSHSELGITSIREWIQNPVLIPGFNNEWVQSVSVGTSRHAIVQTAPDLSAIDDHTRSKLWGFGPNIYGELIGLGPENVYGPTLLQVGGHPATTAPGYTRLAMGPGVPDLEYGSLVAETPARKRIPGNFPHAADLENFLSQGGSPDGLVFQTWMGDGIVHKSGHYRDLPPYPRVNGKRVYQSSGSLDLVVFIVDESLTGIDTSSEADIVQQLIRHAQAVKFKSALTAGRADARAAENLVANHPADSKATLVSVSNPPTDAKATPVSDFRGRETKRGFNSNPVFSAASGFPSFPPASRQQPFQPQTVETKRAVETKRGFLARSNPALVVSHGPGSWDYKAWVEVLRDADAEDERALLLASSVREANPKVACRVYDLVVRHPSWQIAWRGASRLRHAPDECSFELFQYSLNHENSLVKQAAAQNLNLSVPGIKALLREALASPDAGVVMFAAEVLKDRKAPKSWQ